MSATSLEEISSSASKLSFGKCDLVFAKQEVTSEKKERKERRIPKPAEKQEKMAKVSKVKLRLARFKTRRGQ